MKLDDVLTEAAERTFRRKQQQITRYYRCTSGPKKGKLASDPSKCGIRPDPKRVRHGKKVARQKGSVRVRKTIIAKKSHISKRVTQLNKLLRNRHSTTSNVKKESNVDALLNNNMLTEMHLDILIEQINHTDDLVSNNTLTLDRLISISNTSGYSITEDDIAYVDDVTVKSPSKLEVVIMSPSDNDPDVLERGTVYLRVDAAGNWKADF